MTKRPKVWFVVAVLFVVVNLGGAVYALGMRELPHAALHVALLLPGAYVVRRLARRAWGQRNDQADGADMLAQPEYTDRLSHLEQSLDAVAIEIERVGEGQRFMARVLTEKRGAPAGVDGGAEAVSVAVKDVAPPSSASTRGPLSE